VLLACAAFLCGCGGGAALDDSSDSSGGDNDNPPPAPSAEIPPVQDVYVAADQPAPNFNTSTASCGTCGSMVMVMSASNTGTFERQTLLKYDLTSLPHGPTQKLLILSAELHIQYLGGIAVNTDDDVTFSAYRCAQNWSEAGVSWSNKPVRLGGSIGSVLVRGTQFDCYLPLNPSVVQEWINMPATNYGIILSGSGGNGINSCKSMPSQEYNGKGITLDVTYTLQ
jgi:hypothetical protein